MDGSTPRGALQHKCCQWLLSKDKRGQEFGEVCMDGVGVYLGGAKNRSSGECDQIHFIQFSKN